MKFKPDSNETQEYPVSGMVTEKDLRNAHRTTRQYFESEYGSKEKEAWDKHLLAEHPEWFPDKKGKPWHQYWAEYWRTKGLKV